jgi:hypothetical protein
MSVLNKNIIPLVISFLFLAGCSSVNPYGLNEGTGAYLKERLEYRGKARFAYVFTAAETSEGKKYFDMGLIRREEVMIYKIPPGEITLNLKIIYTPEVRSYITRHFEDKYEIRVIKLDPFILEDMTIEEAESFRTSGLKGISFNALEGQTYQINCKIDNGKAYIWIEDISGKKVSQDVFGIGVRSGEYFPWETLPPPVL